MSGTLLINNILNAAAERRASDVHLAAGTNPVIRVEGRLVTLTEQQVLKPDTLLVLAEILLSKSDLEVLNQKREVVTIYSWANRARYRVKAFYQKGYLALSLRIIPPYILSPKDLNIPLSIVQMLNCDQGLLIITGPYASGRTTTAASLLETINQNIGWHIQTLEQPIEYLFVNNHAVVEQREVGRDVPDFVTGLKDMRDDDVDVVYVSSFFEDGVGELVLELAESGKLVILVMDADSVISAIDRFISHLPLEKRLWGQDLLAEVLIGVLSQRLLPRLTGGLTLAAEVLTMTSAVRSSIRDNNLRQLESIMQTSKEEGMISLDKSLQQLIRVGEISPEEAKKNAINKEEFK
ncbi:MAG: hypothetical protein C3F02_03365 [Parcubacteria group bacterium]|nr:MAG: hypothetical protein C3F02_03365 [Parcubacteria group bacterium]